MDLFGLGIILGGLIPLVFTPKEHLSKIGIALPVLIGTALILSVHFGLWDESMRPQL